MGTATYLVLNSIVTAIVLLIVKPWRHQSKRLTRITLIHLLVMTAVFDSIIVGLGIVAYDPTKLTGIRIGLAPIEDFSYSILAACTLPTIWQLAGKWRKRESHES